MADTNNNNKPFKQFSRIGNASFEMATWPNGGRNTLSLRIANKLRVFNATKENPEPSAEYLAFKEYGQIEIFPSDVPAILDACVHLRDDLEISVTFKPRKVA